MSKIEKIAQEIEALIETVNPLTITPEEFEQKVSDAINHVRSARVSERDLTEAAPTSILTTDWSFGGKHLQPYRNAAGAVGRVAQVKEEVTRLEDETEVIRFTGFHHDVALACFLMDMLLTMAEKDWTDFTETAAFKQMTRSQIVGQRKKHIRAAASDFAEELNKVAYKREVAAMDEPRTQTITTTKRRLVSSSLSQAA